MNLRRLSCLLLLFLIACSPVVLEEASSIRIHFIDVGQGDSVLIQGSNGQNVLYDGGRNNEDSLGYLQDLGVTKLDMVIASHPDADHIGGLDVVVEIFKPRFFMDNGIVATTQAYENLLKAVKEAKSDVLSATKRSISLGKAELKIIPPPNDPELGRNDNSIGVIIDFGDFEAALTGDAEEKEFAWWQANSPELLEDVEVYKASHHGSNNGDNEASLETWKPEVVVIGVGATNPFGHPTPEALELYRKAGADIYRTDEQGHVIISVNSEGRYTISTQK